MEFKTKPCPVCGGKSLQVIAITKDEQTRYFVRCTKCGHEGPFSLRSDLEAKGAWNGCVDEYQNAKPTTRKTILDAAEKCVCQDRQDTHGKPEDSFSEIAMLWTAYTGNDISPVDVAQMMILLKVGRAKGNPKHTDNWVDMAGYAACAGEIAVEIYGE
mgnify:CR=1 FL=1